MAPAWICSPQMLPFDPKARVVWPGLHQGTLPQLPIFLFAFLALAPRAHVRMKMNLTWPSVFHCFCSHALYWCQRLLEFTQLICFILLTFVLAKHCIKDYTGKIQHWSWRLLSPCRLFNFFFWQIPKAIWEAVFPFIWLRLFLFCLFFCSFGCVENTRISIWLFLYVRSSQVWTTDKDVY